MITIENLQKAIGETKINLTINGKSILDLFDKLIKYDALQQTALSDLSRGVIFLYFQSWNRTGCRFWMGKILNVANNVIIGDIHYLLCDNLKVDQYMKIQQLEFAHNNYQNLYVINFLENF